MRVRMLQYRMLSSFIPRKWISSKMPLYLAHSKAYRFTSSGLQTPLDYCSVWTRDSVVNHSHITSFSGAGLPRSKNLTLKTVQIQVKNSLMLQINNVQIAR